MQFLQYTRCEIHQPVLRPLDALQGMPMKGTRTGRVRTMGQAATGYPRAAANVTSSQHSVALHR